LAKRPQHIPALLTRAEVAAILDACTNARYRTMLTLTYGCGLRLSEVLAVRVSNIDGERRLLRAHLGNGAKDRLVPISPTLLAQLRAYWRVYRPAEWLFAGRGGTPLSPTRKCGGRRHLVLGPGTASGCRGGLATPRGAGKVVCEVRASGS
jgi:integrase